MSFISLGFYKLTASASVEVKCREEVTRLWGGNWRVEVMERQRLVELRFAVL